MDISSTDDEVQIEMAALLNNGRDTTISIEGYGAYEGDRFDRASKWKYSFAYSMETCFDNLTNISINECIELFICILGIQYYAGKF